MKTAISVPDDIFEEVDRLAKDHNWSRSEVFVIAVKHYLDNLKSQKLLAALNWHTPNKSLWMKEHLDRKARDTLRGKF